jgi:hypothetical protein
MREEGSWEPNSAFIGNPSPKDRVGNLEEIHALVFDKCVKSKFGEPIMALHRRLGTVAVTLALGLAGCAGNGSGGGPAISPPLENLLPPPPPPEPPPSGINFVDWADVAAHPDGFKFALAGYSREATAPDTPSALKPNATLRGSYSSAGIADLVMSSGGTNLVPRGPYEAVLSDDPRLHFLRHYLDEFPHGYVADPFASDWNYQTFGLWGVSYLTFDSITPQGGRRMGALTVGAQTNVVDVPATGTATYTGFSAGNYFATSYFATSAVTANLVANVDFAQRKVALSLTDSIWADIPRPELDLSGTLTFASGVNGFAGPVTTLGGGEAGAPMTGTANGFFYGPGAAELGGVFWVTSGQSNAYIGAFGARK